MFAYFLTVAARLAEIRARNQAQLDSLNLNNNMPEGVTKVVDTSIPEEQYKIKLGDLEFNPKSSEALEKILSIFSNFQPNHSFMKNVVDNLTSIEEDLERDYKSGTQSFAMIFTDDAELVSTYDKIDSYPDFKFFLYTKKSDADQYKAPFPGVLSYNAREKNIIRMPLTNNFEALVAASILPSFCRIDEQTYKYLQNLDQKLFYIIDNQKNYNSLHKTLLPATKTCSGFAKFVFFDPSEVPDLIKLLKVSDSDYPVMISLANEAKGLVKNISLDNFMHSVTLLIEKKCEKLIFNSEIPEDNESRALKVVNTDSFAKFTDSSEKDVLIVFTSPRCGYCKALEPILIKFSEILKSKEIPISVGNYNIIENETQADFVITGVPSLFFLKKGSKTPEKILENSRTLKDLLTYISTDGVSSKIDISQFQEYLVESKSEEDTEQSESLEKEEVKNETSEKIQKEEKEVL